MREPGLDLHEWETRWAELEEALRDDPVAGLPDAADFVEELLTERGLAPESEELGTAELVQTFRFAREVADRVAAAEDVDPGDVGQAIENLRAVYATLSVQRPA